MVENLVQIELAYINTKHPDFHEATLIQKSVLAGEFSEKAHNKGDASQHVKINEPANKTSSTNETHVNGVSPNQLNGILNDSSLNIGINGLSLSSNEIFKFSARSNNVAANSNINQVTTTANGIKASLNNTYGGINLLPEIVSLSHSN